MKKTYPTSTKAQQWAKHLKPFGKRMANKSTRKINKEVQDDDDFPTRPAASKKKKMFAIEFNNGGDLKWGWDIWKKYVTESRRNRSLENLIKKYKSSPVLKNYEFRALNLK